MSGGPPNHTRLLHQKDIALAVLRETMTAVDGKMPADATLGRIFRQHPGFGSRDRRHYSHVVFSFFRWRGWIALLAPDDLGAQVAWALALDGTAAEDELVNHLIGRLNLPDDARGRLASADLREKVDQLAHLRPECALRPEHLVPDWVGTAINRAGDAGTFIASCQRRPPTWVRVDPGQVKDFSTMLDAQRLAHRADDRVPGAVRIDTPFQVQLLERAWGWSIQIQDIGSQAVCAASGAEPGASWWDACCGAGGKALALSRMVGPEGCVVATDVRESVLANLRRRAGAFRTSNIETMMLDSSTDAPPGRIFDGVLVDAPCSGLGTWPRNPDARWRTTPREIGLYAQQQRDLLHRVAPRVKVGGLLVYALCTLTTAESFDVVSRFLEEHPEFQLEPFTDPLGTGHMAAERLILPGEGPGDGMFMARMRRIA